MEGDGKRMKGTVDFFNNIGGSGFIAASLDDKFIPFQKSSVRTQVFGNLGKGVEVEYLISTDGEGQTIAIDVTGPEEGPIQGLKYGGEEGSGAGGDYGSGRDRGQGYDAYGGGSDLSRRTDSGNEYVRLYNPGPVPVPVPCSECNMGDHEKIDCPVRCGHCWQSGHSRFECKTKCFKCGQDNHFGQCYWNPVPGYEVPQRFKRDF